MLHGHTVSMQDFYAGDAVVENPPAKQETQVRSLGWEDAPREGNGNPLQYSCLGIPWTEEPGGLQSMGHKASDTTYRLNNNNTA